MGGLSIFYIENKRKRFQNSRPQMLPSPSPQMKPHIYFPIRCLQIQISLPHHFVFVISSPLENRRSPWRRSSSLPSSACSATPCRCAPRAGAAAEPLRKAPFIPTDPVLFLGFASVSGEAGEEEQQQVGVRGVQPAPVRAPRPRQGLPRRRPPPLRPGRQPRPRPP